MCDAVSPEFLGLDLGAGRKPSPKIPGLGCWEEPSAPAVCWEAHERCYNREWEREREKEGEKRRGVEDGRLTDSC